MHNEQFEALILEKISKLAPPINCGVIEKSTPVISFGDFTTAQIATLGINPSAAEFQSAGKLLKSGYKRLADQENGPNDPMEIWWKSKYYFLGNPYWSWFKHLEELLLQIGGSYRTNACHLDLSPWATNPIFGKLSPDQQKTLLNHDRDLLNWQISQSTIKTILFNGATVRNTIDISQNYHLQKVAEFKYTSGGREKTSDLITGDGPQGASIFGWTLNLQALQATVEERADVMNKIAEWLKNDCKIDLN